ncbi:hypothetical protein [Microbacterium enclense]|uniref:hypothetical protein n=1 Tax=Microbacterium enclense TaxID=993073 RepID=UPI003F7D8607
MTGRFAAVAARTLTASLATAALVAGLLSAPPAAIAATPVPTLPTPLATATATPEPTASSPASPSPSQPSATPTSAPTATATPPATLTPAPTQTPEPEVTPVEVTPMADLSLFRAGNIISDLVFFDSTTMDEAQIDTFLKGKVPRCLTGYTCLKDFRQATATRGEDSYCSTYSGESSESAARIIAKVAAACGINPQVLIVMLEKEQGLVTHTWPSDWRYTIAMGQGCPDTAACDTRYYGFFNQMYGAARQLKIYSENRYFTYYAPGKTWNVRFHPNASCGSSPVYIENQATANLYYYTPYQPNAAAIRAGYGQGDSCSAYGNRNFYQRFVDWFGSTQSRYGSLMQGAGRPDVFLVSNGMKHRVQTWDDLVVWRAKAGGVSTVPTAYVDNMPTGADVGRYIHDPRSGTLYLLEVDGTKHRFANSDQIATFGYAFGSFVNIESRLVDAFRTGPDVGTLVRVGSAPEAYVLEAGKRRHIYDGAAWAQVSRNTPGYVATMRADAGNAIALGATVFAANTLVRGVSSGDVLLATRRGELLHIPSFGLAAEFGATSYSVVPDAALARSSVSRTSLTPVVVCGGETLIASGGTLYPLTGLAATGLKSSTPSADQCSTWSRISSTRVSDPVFVQPVGTGDVFVVQQGRLRHVRSYGELMSLNGSRPLNLLGWTGDTAGWVGYGAPLLADGSIVQFGGKGEVYRFSGGELHHVQSYATLLRLGDGAVPPIEPLPASYFSAYRVGSPLR